MGSCLDALKTNYKEGIKDDEVLATILRDVLRGLSYFHKQGHIHRDIKSGNILMAQDGTIKLSDYGVSAVLVESGYKRQGRQTFVGTPCFMAPEIIERDRKHNAKA